MTDAPALVTDRLILRPHREDDLDHCCALWGDAEVVRYIGGTAQDRQAVWFRLLRYAGMWAMLGYGMWVIEDRETGAFLGEAGLLNACRGLPALEGVPEVGWVLTPAAWGRGIATEAMRAVLDWADRDFGAPVVRCIIEEGNGASIGVAGKLGFIRLSQTLLQGAPILVMDRHAG